MTEYRIVWIDPQPPETVEFAQGLLPESGFRIVAPATSAEEELRPLLADADALLTQYRPIDSSTLAQAPNLRFIQKYGRRDDGLDLTVAREAGTRVAVMPLRGCIAVAEHAMTLMMALSKQLIEAHQDTATGAYRELGLTPVRTSQQQIAFQWMKLPHLLELYGTTLGIIGYGEIGTEVSVRARAFGMRVLYNKRTALQPEIEARFGVAWADRETILRESDVVLLSAPHTAETERIIGAQELSLMKPSAYLVNIARGGLVDEAALYDALSRRRIAGAGLDVFVEEPVPYNNPLLTLDNVILTPHIGGGTGGGRLKQMTDVLENIVRAARGETPLHLLA
ncbi:MAG: putative 2-hydroxyacid dehydrogenase [Chloroflexi bacterium]|nr:putative 2-hydroxyacid dehydrogenase [Chloroflexota bacterium]